MNACRKPRVSAERSPRTRDIVKPLRYATHWRGARSRRTPGESEWMPRGDRPGGATNSGVTACAAEHTCQKQTLTLQSHCKAEFLGVCCCGYVIRPTKE